MSSVQTEKNEKSHSTEINNLITIDIGTVVGFFTSFHETWGCIVNILIGLGFLYLKLKEVIFIGFVVSSILMLINFWIAKKIGTYYNRMMKFKDQRISLSSDVLNGIK